MLHLDQNHGSSLSSPHAKPSSLILSSAPRPDQQSLLSWSVPNPDERTFFQEQQEHPAAEQPSTPPIKPDALHTSVETPTEQAVSTESQPPGHAEDSKLAEHSPSSPPDATSPALESTSSLTPPPSNTSPAFSLIDLPDPEAADHQRVEGADDEEKTKGDASGDVAEKPSRASTPLSELSSAPEADEPLGAERRPDDLDEKSGNESGDIRSVANPAKVTVESMFDGGEPAKASSMATNVVNEPLIPDQLVASGSRATSIASKIID
jgi:hypothetical protein